MQPMPQFLRANAKRAAFRHAATLPACGRTRRRAHAGTYLFASAFFALAVGATTAPHAYAQNIIDERGADAANEKGKELLYSSDVQGAITQFRVATDKSNSPKYPINLCQTLFQVGQFSEALDACALARTRNPDAAQLAKIEKLEARTRTDAKAQGHDLDNYQPRIGTGSNNGGSDPTTGGGDPGPNGGTPTGGNPTTGGTGPTGGAIAPVVGRPPTLPPAEPTHHYMWAVGGGLMGGAFTGATNGGEFSFAGMRGDFRYTLNEALSIGVHGRLSLGSLSPANSDRSTGSLINLGVGIYKDFPLNALVITPAVGIHAYSLGAEFAANGGLERAEGGGFYLGGTVGYALGARREHVFGVTLEYEQNLPGKTNSGIDVEGFGGVMASIGYQFRFDTALGSTRTSFFTLE